MGREETRIRDGSQTHFFFFVTTAGKGSDLMHEG